MGIYRYLAAKIGAGVGSQNMAFQRPQTVPVVGFSPGNHLVRQPFQPISVAGVMLGQSVVPVSLLGTTGAAMQGQFVSSPLARPVRGS